MNQSGSTNYNTHFLLHTNEVEIFESVDPAKVDVRVKSINHTIRGVNPEDVLVVAGAVDVDPLEVRYQHLILKHATLQQDVKTLENQLDAKEGLIDELQSQVADLEAL